MRLIPKRTTRLGLLPPSSMNYLRGAVNAISAPYQYYKDINPSTLTGAIDVIVVTRPTETGETELACTPFHVRFGKLQVLRPSDKKVNVSVNGQPIPFNMKIGEAGEAFFVFETEGDVPEEFMTSPILQATRPDEDSNASSWVGSSGAAPVESGSIAVHVNETAGETAKNQEPDFLDLDASPPTSPNHAPQDSTQQPPASLPESTLSLSPPALAMSTPPHQGVGRDHTGVDIPAPQIDIATESMVKRGPLPRVMYTDDIAIDATGYHPSQLQERGPSRNSSASLVTTRSPSPDRRTSRSSSRLRRQHNLKLTPSVPVPFPIVRATSEPPQDTGLENEQAHPRVDDSLTDEYSWDWGAFPHRSQAGHAGKDAQWANAGSRIRTAVLSDAGHELDTASRFRGRSDNDAIDLEHHRSHSVPPALEGSPASKRRGNTATGESNADRRGAVNEYSSLIHDGRESGRTARGINSSRDTSCDFGVGGKLFASHEDSTKFGLAIEGRAMTFELSVIESIEGYIFSGRDEVEVERLFDAGKIDFSRFLEDESVIANERLVIRWAGGQYIDRSDNSPLMNALSLWRDTVIHRGINEVLSPEPLSSASPPPLSDDEDGQTEKDSGDDENPAITISRAHSEPPEPSPVTRKPTSSSWVRWWTRSRSNRDKEMNKLPGTKSSTIQPLPSVSPDEAEETKAESDRISPAQSNVGSSVTSGAADTNLQSMAVPKKKYAKTLRLTSDQLKVLNLKHGANRITFSLSATGAVACTARIFVWDSLDQIVVSDIDGTITKSDGLGHVFAMIGRDWTHSGVAKLYTDITRNGYKVMYLTSRAIGQADSTRDYLRNIKQDDYQLPEGPVIMSPDRLMASLHREVIMRKPEVFKMACLRDIQRLFGDTSRETFYAGFGNRITDALSYRSVNVPSARIFTIDHTGEVKMELLELAGYKSSYIYMTDLVDQMFPPINRKWDSNYTDFNYWKTPIQEFPLPDLSPPSPALSARSDTSNTSTLARFLGASRQASVKQTSLLPTSMPASVKEERTSSLRQMSSFELLSNTISSFTRSTSSSSGSRRRSPSPGSYSSSTTFLDSENEEEEEVVNGVGGDKRRRTRTPSMVSVPSVGVAKPSNAQEDIQAYEEDEVAAAEHAFDEDFFTTGEMQNVPFL